jgi:glutamate receptor, ionotropic, invertebrate
MIGELARKSADLGASPLFFTADRVDVIDYIACTSETRSKFVFRSPKLSYTDNVFLLPFDVHVWASLGTMILIASFVLYIASRTEWKSSITQESNDPSVLRPSFYETFFVLFCAFCQQGSFSLPVSFGSRLITMISFTALMFMYASYSANIVALLQSPSSKIKTLDDLYNSRLQMAADDTVFNHYYFAHAEEKVRKAIYTDKIRRKEGGENFYNISDGVRMVRHGLFAFHMEVGVGYKILLETFQEDEKCGLQEIQFLQVIDPFYAIQKNSSYKEMFKVGLLLLNEFGLQDRENSRLYTKKPKCSGHGAKFISVGRHDVEPAFLIYLYGVVAAFVIFVLEKLHHEFKFKKFF